MIRTRGFPAAFAAFVLVASLPLAAQERVERTGSRVGSDATKRTVVEFGSSSEVRRVLSLLEQNRTAEAVEFARDYLESLSSTVTGSGTPVARKRYFALNALCVALTKDGRPDEAVEVCTDATELAPSQWIAFNSRATAHYSARRFELSLEDYRRALEVAPDEAGIVETLEHNIALAEGRLAER